MEGAYDAAIAILEKLAKEIDMFHGTLDIYLYAPGLAIDKLNAMIDQIRSGIADVGANLAVLNLRLDDLSDTIIPSMVINNTTYFILNDAVMGQRTVVFNAANVASRTRGHNTTFMYIGTDDVPISSLIRELRTYIIQLSWELQTRNLRARKNKDPNNNNA